MSSTPHAGAPKIRDRRWLDTLAAIAFIAVCASYLWDRYGSDWPSQADAAPIEAAGSVPTPAGEPLPPDPVVVAGAPRLGSPEARAAMAVYSDFECPYCKRFADEVMPALQRDYIDTGQLALTFHHAPIEQLHPNAVKAAVAAACAGEQGRFWPMHDALFSAPRQLDEASLRQHAGQLGLDRPTFDTCLSGETVEARVRAERAVSQSLGVRGTPAFLFGTVEPDGRLRVTRRFSGALPIANFREVLDELLAPLEPDNEQP